jgi:hypothetical protein
MSEMGLCHPHGMMECWSIGIVGIERGESVTFGSGALRLRIASLRHKANDFWPSASSPPHADAPPPSIRVIPIPKHIIEPFQLRQSPCTPMEQTGYKNIPYKTQQASDPSALPCIGPRKRQKNIPIDLLLYRDIPEKRRIFLI